MKKSRVVLLHTGYWLLYCFLFTFLFFVSNATTQDAFENWDDWLVIVALAILAGCISFYSFYFWLVPRFVFKRHWISFVVAGLAFCLCLGAGTTLLFSLAVTLLLSVALNITEFILFSATDQLLLTALFTLLGLVNGAIAMVIRGFVTWYGNIHLKEMLDKRNLETELELLKARINPHFLFNTLNNIDVLIDVDAQKASCYLNKLSDILRFVLYETQGDRIPLRRELEYIEKYIDLQKIRSSNEHFVSLRIEVVQEGAEIAPMVFIPYIENAFKYAVDRKANEAIRIHIVIGKDKIEFQCENAINSRFLKPEHLNGIGNKLLDSRLRLLYGDDYQLDIKSSSEIYQVNLELPIRINELSHY